MRKKTAEESWRGGRGGQPEGRREKSEQLLKK